MLEDIHPTRLHTLQHRQTRRKRFFQEKKNTLSEEKEGFLKHTKEAFPSIKGDSYNKPKSVIRNFFVQKVRL